MLRFPLRLGADYVELCYTVGCRITGSASDKLDGWEALHCPKLCEGAVRKSIYTRHHYLQGCEADLAFTSQPGNSGLVLQLFGQSAPCAFHVPAQVQVL